MDSISAAMEIERLLKFALEKHMIEILDVIPARNALMDLLHIDEPYDGETDFEKAESPAPILEKLLRYACETGLLPDNTVTQRDLFDTRIMGILMPRESEVAGRFNETVRQSGIEKATDEFYALSQNSNYIRMDRISKNLYWETKTQYGPIEITINLSKPEKDPREIAAARSAAQTNYPKCLLCLENVGYAGNIKHPARQNHRVIPLMLNNEQWYFQYSPYVYYNEHCIVFYDKHVPMKICDSTFVRLMDFIEKFPHYFIGSNADLPIVGGSILNHEHFQGGRHVFPMEKASVERKFVHPDYSDVKAGILKWPMSVIRISCSDREKIINLACRVLSAWRDYSDESVRILSHTINGGEKIPHNTITPIARKNSAGEYELDLVLRNNRTTGAYPYGIFHPHENLHHIKKENIGLIEVMGLAILPGRLNQELGQIKDILTGRKAYAPAEIEDGKNPLCKHAPWIREMVDVYGTKLDGKAADETLRQQVGRKFLDVLLDAGVYKKDTNGEEAFNKFMYSLGFRQK